MVASQRGATLTWRGLRSVREVALRVRPTQGKVTVTLGGRVVGTRKLDRKVVRIGALSKLVHHGHLGVRVTSHGRPVRIESVYVTR